MTELRIDEPRPANRISAVSGSGLAGALRDVLLLLLVAAGIWTVVFQIQRGVFGFDFRGTVWDPALAIRHGASIFPAPTRAAVDVGNPALYPPLVPLLAVPLTFLPWWLAVTVWTCLLAGAVATGLRLLGVRDWRCYTIAFTSPIVTSGLVFGNLALLLVPAAALAWKYRGESLRAGAAVGLAIAGKLLVWPLCAWLLAARRRAALLWSVCIAGAAIVVPWALIGFDGLRQYPSLLRLADRIYAPQGFGLAAAASALGLRGAASAICLLAAVVLVILAVAATRRPGGEPVGMTLAVLAAVLGAPVAWPYTYALLLVPIAVASKRFSVVWLSLVLFRAADYFPRHRSRVPHCCRPEGTPELVWKFNHLQPSLPVSLAYVVAAVVVAATSIAVLRRGQT